MMNLQKLIFILISVFVGRNSFARAIDDSSEFKIYSPSKNIIANIFIDKGKRLFYSIYSGSKQILQDSPLGISVDGNDLGTDVKITDKPKVNIINERYAILGNHASAFNHANEAIFTILSHQKNIKLIVRVYDDGVAVRYTLPDDANQIGGESTTWNIPSDVKAVAWSDFNPVYEGLSHVTTIDKLPRNTPLMPPITFEVGNKFLSITEADCENFSDMCLIRDSFSF